MKDKINTGKLTANIINIGKSCINISVKEVVISSILAEKNIALTRLLRQMKDSLKDLVLSLMTIFQEHISGKIGYI